MSFVVPPLPGERLLTPKEVAARVGCHVSAIYGFINDGKLAAVTVADRLLIGKRRVEPTLDGGRRRPDVELFRSQ